jgi:hypothetical protein
VVPGTPELAFRIRDYDCSQRTAYLYNTNYLLVLCPVLYHTSMTPYIFSIGMRMSDVR